MNNVNAVALNVDAVVSRNRKGKIEWALCEIIVDPGRYEGQCLSSSTVSHGCERWKSSDPFT